MALLTRHKSIVVVIVSIALFVMWAGSAPAAASNISPNSLASDNIARNIPGSFPKLQQLPTTTTTTVVTSPAAPPTTAKKAVVPARVAPRIVLPTKRIISAPIVIPIPPGNKWACIIRRESGGNPRAINRSSMAGGLFQFLPSSWHAYGGTGNAWEASVAEQWRVALHAYAISGWSPWVAYDGC